MSQRVCVLGSGSWGTALAHHLKSSGAQVCIWGIEPEDLQNISKNQCNPAYFPEHKLAPGINTSLSLAEAVQGADCIVLAVPSSAVREVSKQLKSIVKKETLLVIVAKGLEQGSLKLLSEVVKEELSESEDLAVLSGPSFAKEVLEAKPTAVTIAAKNLGTAEAAAKLFHHENFRVYTSSDLVGVQLGGAVKNIIALAVGIIDGKKMGLNARAALVTRGLAEIGRLVKAMGGESRTVSGLSGLGDLLLTATGDLSRNRQVGLLLGRGKTLEQALAEVGQVAEGVVTAPKILNLAKKMEVEMPITAEVVAVIEGSHSVEEAMESLLARGGREE